jgi:hypothetical protein
MPNAAVIRASNDMLGTLLTSLLKPALLRSTAHPSVFAT